MVARKERETFLRETISFMSHERVARTPLAMHQRRGAGGGVRACGARARDRERRGARAAERDSIADGTALRCGRVGSRHFRRHRGFIPEGSFRGHYPRTCDKTTFWQ